MHHTRTTAAPPPLPRAVYVFVSHRLFLLTNVLKDAFIPHDDNRLLARNLILLAAAGVDVVYGAGTLGLGFLVSARLRLGAGGQSLGERAAGVRLVREVVEPVSVG